MKRLLTSLMLLVVLAGVGCSTAPTSSLETYENTQYGFSFKLAEGHEAHVREDAVRQTTYLGLPADFFMSLRDIVREKKASNIAYFYAIKDLSTDAFTDSLKKSGAGVEIVKVEDVDVGDFKAKRVESTTEAGDPKFHYLLPVNGATLVISVFLNESAVFDGMKDSFRKL